ncbi:MAG: hypothetical protein Q9178_006730 [Gyalolechia marmorata]
MDPSLGTDFPEISYDEFLQNWEAFAASNLVGDPPVIPEPEALTEPNSHDTTDLFDGFIVQPDQDYVPCFQEATVVDNYYPHEGTGIFNTRQEEMPLLSTRLHETIAANTSATENSRFEYTKEDGATKKPATTYSNPDNMLGRLDDTHNLSSSRENRKTPGNRKAPISVHLSKEKARRARLEGDRVEKAESGRRKRKVAVRDGNFCVQLSNDLWAPAVYHREIRAELVAEAPPHRYRHLPASGSDELDVTSYFEPHKDWGFESRDDRPDVCFEWTAREASTDEQPGIMKHKGLIVLDNITNKPIRDFPIPSCISSKVEGGRLEAMLRENHHRISKQDFRARMPHLVSGIPPPSEGALGMRMNRFRALAGLPSSNPRGGSSEKKRALIQCIPAATMETILQQNSTRKFRDLDAQEIAYVDSQTRGSNPEKAGGRRLTSEDRQRANAARNSMVMGYKPVNPNAVTSMTGVRNDLDAANVARRRGSERLYTANDDDEAHQDGASLRRKRRRYEGKEVAVSHNDVPKTKTKRRDTHRDIQCARGTNQQVQPLNFSQMPKASSITSEPIEFGPKPIENRRYAKTEAKGHPGVLGNQVDFGDFEATNKRNRNSRLNPCQSPIGPSTRGASSSPATQDLDYRLKAPANDDEASTIAKYIRFITSDIIRILGHQPPSVPHGESYMNQWKFLSTWYIEHCPLDPLPQIWQCTKPWNGWPNETMSDTWI